MRKEQSSRRRFLATALAVSAVGLSGCGSGGSGTTTEPDEGQSGDTPADDGTPTPTEEPDSGDTPADDTPADNDTPADDTPADDDTPDDDDTPEQASELTNWASYQVNSGNWGHHPDAAGPHSGVSAAWTFEVNEKEVNSAPILVDGTLYVGSGGPGDQRGTFYALDARSGEEKWSKQLDAPITGGAAAGRFIYVGTGSGLIKAYEPNGNTWWEFEIQSNEELTAPVVGDENVYFGSNAARLFSFNGFDGTKQWTDDITGEVTGAPAFADGRVYISSKDDKVYAINQSGQEEWSNNLGDNANGVAVRDGNTYATANNGTIWSLNRSGRRNWTTQTGDPILSPPAVSDDAVFAGSDDNKLIAVERSSGNERWRFEEPGDKVSAPPVVADGTVYFGCQDSRVYAVDAESGEMEWSKGTGDSIDNASPVVSGGMVFIGSDDGAVYAFSE